MSNIFMSHNESALPCHDLDGVGQLFGDSGANPSGFEYGFTPGHPDP